MMQFRRARLAARLALAAVLAVGLAGCGGDDEETTVTTLSEAPSSAPTTPTTLAARLVEVVVRGGSVQGGGRQEVPLNERVRVRVTSDVEEEVHVHGYNHRFQVGPTGPAEITFVANLPGVFEVELEKSQKRLLSLEVKP
ncbi:MAG TPA: hypothetical protein VG078_12400 [Acidimicrobiales bacterium]|nr:hypothetical protein [Acidimicrobiales bacterium]